MKKGRVRIEKIEIENFKNVKTGQITFKNNRKNYKASILGIYGQNGSGKTALIDAIMLLKYALCGQVVPLQYADYIHVEADSAKLRFEFSVEIPESGTSYGVVYEFKLKKEQNDNIQNVSEPENTKAVIFDEVLSCSYVHGNEKNRMAHLINTSAKEVFTPRNKYQELVGKDKETATDLEVAKRLASATSRSFIFSRELLTVIRENCKRPIYTELLEMLVEYGNFELFVINTQNNGLITMNALPLAFKYESETAGAVGNIMLPLDEAETIPKEAAELIEKIIPNMNMVLSQIVPGLTISMYNFGPQVLKNGNIGCRVQLMSRKNSKEIPLRYESEGIKKIVSILQLLIVVYNKASITVAIDELDSGVFEYLLGELLRIISEKGKGQLIFTSHNLRPLETLDRGFIAFTTTNPENRYLRMVNVKENHNLRDFYYRDIVLGEQNEVVYEPTNNYEIALAFREAGEM
ncbi:MAG: AAA family ATPase [Lachnospiraceae bacterium]|nr:AAA family ATPase [Lachnospiraceae bacterium]MDY4971591.1 AAA family ATPase [Lachnospiraceae bacterium]